MNCHQILSGACNAGDSCFAVGSVEGVSFTVRKFCCCILVFHTFPTLAEAIQNCEQWHCALLVPVFKKLDRPEWQSHSNINFPMGEK